LQPSIVTYGRQYGGENIIQSAEEYFTDIKFKRVTHKYDKLQSTTKIIDKIRK